MQGCLPPLQRGPAVAQELRVQRTGVHPTSVVLPFLSCARRNHPGALVRTGQHVGERVEHGLRVQAGGERLVLGREGGQRVLPPGGQLPADDGVQLRGLLRAVSMQAVVQLQYQVSTCELRVSHQLMTRHTATFRGSLHLGRCTQRSLVPALAV